MSPIILFVEDDKDDEEIMREILEQVKFSDFNFYHDGNAVLNHLATLANNQMPDLVVSDLYMPRFNGLELAKAIKADERFVGIWVVIYSGTINPGITIKLTQAGVTGVFKKPDNVEELKYIITQLIELATEHHKQLVTPEVSQIK